MTDDEFKYRLAISWRYFEWCNPHQKKVIPPYWLRGRK